MHMQERLTLPYGDLDWLLCRAHTWHNIVAVAEALFRVEDSLATFAGGEIDEERPERLCLYYRLRRRWVGACWDSERDVFNSVD